MGATDWPRPYFLAGFFLVKRPFVQLPAMSELPRFCELAASQGHAELTQNGYGARERGAGTIPYQTFRNRLSDDVQKPPPGVLPLHVPARYPALAMKEVYDEMERSMREARPLVLATVSSARGSTPRKPGAKMAVRPDGSICGTIGGGCGEAEVWQAAMDTMRDGQPRLVTVDLTEDVEGDDKICGGVMNVFVERLLSPGS